MLYPGSIYITGNISPYIASYYGVSTTQTSNILLTCIVIQCFFLPLGTWIIQQHVNPKLVILLGACFGLPLMFAASCVPQDRYQLFHWCYSLSWSINAGLAYYAPVHHAWIFFPDKLGFASGVVLAGFGGGAIIFDQVSTYLINPKNFKIGTTDFDNAV